MTTPAEVLRRAREIVESGSKYNPAPLSAIRRAIKELTGKLRDSHLYDECYFLWFHSIGEGKISPRDLVVSDFDRAITLAEYEED